MYIRAIVMLRHARFGVEELVGRGTTCIRRRHHAAIIFLFALA